MTTSEAISACEFWTTNLAESQALGSSTDPDVAAAFNGTVWGWRDASSAPDSPKHYEIRVGSHLRQMDDRTGEMVTIANPTFTEIVAEIERRSSVRKAA